MSSKKVSDLYCALHDSEACGCREQLALPNVDYTKPQPYSRAAVEWRRETLGQWVEPSSKPIVSSRDVRVAPDWFVEALNKYVVAIAKYSGISAEHTCLELSKRLGEKLGIPAGEYVMLATAAGLVRVKVRTE